MELVPVKSITPKVCGIDPKAVRKMADGTLLGLGTFFGVVQGVKYVEDRFNTDLKPVFIGEFRAVNPDGSKTYLSEKAHFFGQLAEKLESTFKTGENKPVEFAYAIGSRANDAAPLGYAYEALSLIQTATSNRMDEIAKQVAERTAQLNTPALPAGETKPAEPAPAADSKAAGEAAAPAKPQKKDK